MQVEMRKFFVDSLEGAVPELYFGLLIGFYTSGLEEGILSKFYSRHNLAESHENKCTVASVILSIEFPAFVYIFHSVTLKTALHSILAEF